MAKRGQASGPKDNQTDTAPDGLEPAFAGQGPADDPASREILQTLQPDTSPVEETLSEQSESESIAAAIKEAFSPERAGGDAALPPPPAASKRVEVLFNGRLGPKLLTRGDITDDPAYVALLGDHRCLVREVIE